MTAPLRSKDTRKVRSGIELTILTAPAFDFVRLPTRLLESFRRVIAKLRRLVEIVRKVVMASFEGRLSSSFRAVAKGYANTLVQAGHPRRAHGPSVVVRSLLNGLTMLGIRYNQDPKYISQIGKVCHVISGVPSLHQAVDLKRRGRIDILLAGPNIAFVPDDHDSILAAPEVDACIVPSEWVKQAYECRKPELVGRTYVWPAGVDTEFWKPEGQNGNVSVLVYWKYSDEEFCRAVERLVSDAGWHVIRIVYGKYSAEEYRTALRAAEFCVFLSYSESQGIALAEAWSMDRPTFVWQSKGRVIDGVEFPNLSSAPYLNESVGLRWENIDELRGLLEVMRTGRLEFSPREWVLTHMSDEVSADALLGIIARVKESRSAREG